MAYGLLFVISCLLEASFSLKSSELPEGNLMDYINQDLNLQWVGFKTTYNKMYQDDDEELKRRLHWEDCLKFIQEHNQKYDQGEISFTLGENKFCDLAEDEFEEIYLKGLRVPEDEEYPEGLSEPDLEWPDKIDWRTYGYVSAVKDQGRCGSCWAFSAVGALEGQHAKKYDILLDLSEQHLVDCSRRKYGNYGCRGGFMNSAFRFISDNKGIDGECCYPYNATDGKCHLKSPCIVAKVKGYRNVEKSEYSLKIAVRSFGPVAIAIDANHRSFGLYKKGIYFEPSCSSEVLSHAMVAVGYGTDNNNSYWIVKNSWGKDWGEGGYVLMSRNKGNNCGIATMASYPLV